jgi:hypothetical protein
MAGRPIAPAHHARIEHERAANAGTHCESDNISVTPACTKPHLSGQDRIHVVVAHHWAREPLAKPSREKNAFKKLQFTLEPDNFAQCEINSARTPNAGSLDSG